MPTDSIVYSSDPDFCTTCRRSPCSCADPVKRRQPEPVRLRFSRVSRGSGMTTIERLHISDTMKQKLLSKLKKRFGCGGTVKNGALELQGDRRDLVQKELEAEGYKIKRVGG
jgi:translation initiation factor 1